MNFYKVLEIGVEYGVISDANANALYGEAKNG